MGHAMRQCGAGVGGSEGSNAGQNDVDVIVPGSVLTTAAPLPSSSSGAGAAGSCFTLISASVATWAEVPSDAAGSC